MKNARVFAAKFFMNSFKSKTSFLSTFFFGYSSIYFLQKSYYSRAISLEDNTNSNKIAEFFEKVDSQEIMSKFNNLTVLSSKAVENLMGLIRDKEISIEQFRLYSRRIMRFIIEETLALECDKEVIKEAPLGYYKTRINRRHDNDYVAISILRSGNSMVDELLSIMPGINVGNILIQRDENTHEKKAIFYFEKLPDNLKDKRILLLDPMLATGGSASAAIEILKSKGVKEENIIFLNFVSCVEGIEIMFNKYPKMKIVTSQVDPLLLPNKYIGPGLGDFGDRYYGTMNKE